MSDKYTLPPKKRDWTPGTPQIGVFVRTKMGGTCTMIHDKATSEEEAFVFALIGGLEWVPAEVIQAVRDAWEARVTRHKKKEVP